jgi:hypothetical protein
MFLTATPSAMTDQIDRLSQDHIAPPSSLVKSVTTIDAPIRDPPGMIGHSATVVVIRKWAMSP